jgi:NitT/TauT family transport system ATP-binding protein
MAPARAGSPAIRVRGVRRSFKRRAGRLAVLDGVDLDVGAGEVVAIVGPNGCGKSTLLRIMGGLLAPDEGWAEVGGRPVVGPDPDVGFVFQEPRLLPWRSVIDNVTYPLELAGMAPDERRARARDLLRLVGLEAHADDRPHQLSGGMRQRAAIARALARRPAVLLLDEPFSALDALTRERFNVELLRLWERTGTAIAIVTHGVSEAVFLADRVVVLTERPARVVGEVSSPLRRPRTLADLDAPAVADASAQVRALLGWPAVTDDARAVAASGPAVAEEFR